MRGCLCETILTDLPDDWLELESNRIEGAFPPAIVSLIERRIGSIVVEEFRDDWKVIAWRYKYSEG